MKLDVNVLRYLSKEEFRTLTAVEIGQKNHEIVPVTLIDTLAGLKHGGAVRCLRTLLRHKLLHHESRNYDGYRLTNLGYDFLAIRALAARGALASVGRQIGVGKESDVFEVLSEEGEVLVLKLHRLGRTSFRAVKNQRDYLRHRTSFSWLYLSRLAALKEFAFMRALGEAGLPVPRAVEHNRHAVLMSLVDAYPLVQVRELRAPARVYGELMGLLVRLGRLGLVHCDFNEFNLLVDENEQITLIDFPQMVSMSHANARELFERDTACIDRFFSKKLGYVPEQDPDAAPRARWEDALPQDATATLDVALAASGFQPAHEAALERALAATAREEDDEDDDGDSASASGSEAGDGAAASGDEDEGDSGASEASAAELAALDDAEASGSAEEEEEGEAGRSGLGAEASSTGERTNGVHDGAAHGSRQPRRREAQLQQQQRGGAASSRTMLDSSAAELDSLGELGPEQPSSAEAEAEAGAGAAHSAADAEAVLGASDSESEPEQAASTLGLDPADKGREVQQRLLAQQRKAARAQALARASRNAQKWAPGRRGRKQTVANAMF